MLYTHPMHDFFLINDHLRLEGAIFYPSHKKDRYPAILFVHGWTGERKSSFQYAKSLADSGYVCLLFDLRGHGTSQGDRNNFSSKDFLSDVVAAYDYLSKIKDVDPENISAVGSSFGGYLVALLSGKRKVRNLVLRAPADYQNETFNMLKKIISGKDPNIMKWRTRERKPTETYALEALRGFMGSVLLIESEKDDSIPHQTVLNYKNAVRDKSKLTHVLMKDAPHSIKEGKFRDKVERILVKWFEGRLSSSP